MKTGKLEEGSSAEQPPRFPVFEFSPFQLRNAKELSLTATAPSAPPFGHGHRHGHGHDRELSARTISYLLGAEERASDPAVLLAQPSQARARSAHEEVDADPAHLDPQEER